VYVRVQLWHWGEQITASLSVHVITSPDTNPANMYVFSWKTISMSFELDVYYDETFQQKRRVMESAVKI
jgi:hypothetical protein